MKASTILIEKSQGIKQVTKKYLRLKGVDKTEITGYCALGLLACKSNSVLRYENGIPYVDTDKMHKVFGMDDDYDGKCPIKDCIFADRHRKITVDDKLMVGRVVVHLNDDHKWSFVKIGEFLKDLGY